MIETIDIILQHPNSGSIDNSKNEFEKMPWFLEWEKLAKKE